MRATTGIRHQHWGRGVTAAVAVLLLASACGGGSGYGGSSGTKQPTGATAGQEVGLGKTDAGDVLVDANGMTLYAFANDSRGHSTCTGDCLEYWPPVPGTSSHAGNVTAKLGTVKRSDGSSQLTVDGFPMYTYTGDSSAGQANGQGINQSGGFWWVVSPSGSWIEGTGGTTDSGGSSGY